MDYFENMCTKENILGNILASEQFFFVECKIVAVDDAVIFTSTTASRKMAL